MDKEPATSLNFKFDHLIKFKDRSRFMSSEPQERVITYQSGDTDRFSKPVSIHDKFNIGIAMATPQFPMIKKTPLLQNETKILFKDSAETQRKKMGSTERSARHDYI